MQCVSRGQIGGGPGKKNTGSSDLGFQSRGGQPRCQQGRFIDRDDGVHPFFLPRRKFIHTGIIAAYKDQKPAVVAINGTPVTEKSDSASLVASTEGWWWNTINNGIAYVKTNAVPSGSSVKVNVYMPGTGITVSDITGKDLFKNFSVIYNSGKVSLSFANNFSGKMKAQLYTLQGKLILNREIDVTSGKAVVRNPEARTISGNYILKLEYSDKTAYRKFIALN